MIANAQTFPLDLADYATIAQPWPAFRTIVNDEPIAPSQPALALDDKHWQWPKHNIIFISDPHADADAFVASLIASAGVTRNKKGQLKLTPMGKKATFVIGGDCLDKGPSNLTMLRNLQQFRQTGAKLKILAGNHDLRLLTGLSAISRPRHLGHEHMFVRMGSKVIPLLKEVFDDYLAATDWQQNTPDAATCKAILFPRDQWFAQFPQFAANKLSARAISKEIQRLKGKLSNFEQACNDAGMTMRMAYAAAQQCRQLFCKKGGEFSWFFNEMRLAYKSGSFLFVHAGLDDTISQQISAKGVKNLNREFKKTLRTDLFAFYFSSLATPFRTKYRESDPAFSGQGARAVKRRGIHCVVHGHVSHTNGQQLSLQKGLLHVEGDITLDRNSRKKVGLNGIGFGATIIHPRKMIIGISADHPVAKVLSPHWHNLAVTTRRN